MKNRLICIRSHLIITALITGLFSFDVIIGDIFKTNFKNILIHWIITITIFYLIWILYSFIISKYSKKKIIPILNKDALSFIPFFILALFPLKNLINLGQKFSNFSYLPSALMFTIAFSLFVSIKIIFLSKIKKAEISKKWIFVLALAYFSIFSTLSVLKHLSFYSTGYDLGIYDQTLYGFSEGKLFYSTVGFPLLGMHIEPILFLILPVYMLFKSPITLLIIQTLSISVSVIPLFLIGLKRMKDKIASFLICIAYLANPTIQFSNLFDFHPLVLALPFVLFAFYFFDNKKYKMGLLSLFLAALCKEYLTLLFATFGIYLFFVHKKRKMGVIMSLIGIAWFFINYTVIMPYFYSAPNLFFTMNPYFGNTLGEVIKTFIFRPIYSLKFILKFEKLAFLILLLLPAGLLMPLFAPQILFLASTEIMLVLFYTGTSSIQQIIYHHPIIIVPFLFIATILGIKLLSEKIKRKNLLISLAVFVFLCGILSNIFYGPFTILYDLKDFNPTSAYAKTGHRFVSMIPKEAVVAAPNWVLPHVSEREKVYLLYHSSLGETPISGPPMSGSEYPDYVIIDLSKAVIDTKRNSNVVTDYYLNKLFNETLYGVTEVEGTWLILQKGAEHQKGICNLIQFTDKKKYPYLNIEIREELLKKC